MKNSCKRLCSSTALILVFFLTSLSVVKGQENNMAAPGTEEFNGIGEEVACDTASTVVSESRGETYDIRLTALKDMAGARVWWYAWLTGYSAATAGQAAVYFSSDDKRLRQDMALGAATTFLGAMNQLITPIDPKPLNYPSYREYISGEKPMSPEQAEELLKKLAAWEKKGRSWKTHALAGAVNLGSGLITWLGFKRTIWDGVANFALNTAVTEAQIWTQPTRALKDYERYLRECHTEEGMAPVSPESELTVSVFPGGIAIRLDF